MKKQNNRAAQRQKTVAEAPKTNQNRPYLPVFVLAAVSLIAVYGALLLFESDVLYRIEELSLFLYTPLFFKQQLVVAGGMLAYLGTYFTQYFYHPWLGALLFCLWL